MIVNVEKGYIANINKPKDWTSFGVVRKIRGITRIKKVGHAGTLDPFATGVLLVCLNKATKQTNALMDLAKEYEAQLELGKSTNTLDITGTIINEEPIPYLSSDKIESVLQDITGKLKQRIPDYSAAKVGGHRSYKLARQGKDIPPRFKFIEIYDAKLLAYQQNIITFRISCSRGTYVRTLGYDIAKKLGTIGFLRSLQRTRIGNYKISDSLTIPQFEQQWKKMTANENISQD